MFKKKEGGEIETESSDRVKIGWRKDKPVEDPLKMKRFGFVSAQPSEYLIHYRKGKLRAKSSGQGASCFKWLSDTVAIVPTTLKEVFFEANQITKDNVEIKIKGMVIYHIVDPIKTYKLINFSFRERAEEKLAVTIADMCRSTTKSLVANMTVEECMRKRKDEIATFLKKEIESIVIGDSENSGWGIKIENVDIQDVFLINEEIFKSIQEEYKNKKRLEAEQSKIATEFEMSIKRIEAEKQSRLLELESKATAEIEAVKIKDRVAEAQKNQRLKELDNEAQIKLQTIKYQKENDIVSIKAQEEKVQSEIERDQKIIELKKQLEEIQFAIDKYRVEQNEQIAFEKIKWGCKRAEEESGQKLRSKELEIRGEKSAHDEITAFKRTMQEIENSINEAHLREVFIRHALPNIAQAFATQFGKLNYTHFGGGDPTTHPLGIIAQSFNQILEVAKIHGIDLKGILSKEI
ncbi:MAG: hypothetical protein HQK79_19695 [Desulfobacterales bacterium]|nr:hypothetical protein [Desulfobacterales bacterium]MBF0398310.1 hypothetical protein [Desulfobacterales bacterium]